MNDKQFYLNEGEVDILKILCLKENNEAIYHTASKSDMKMVVELLNSLSEEKEQLKSENKELKSTVEYLKNQLKNYSEVSPDGQWILNQGDLE